MSMTDDLARVVAELIETTDLDAGAPERATLGTIRAGVGADANDFAYADMPATGAERGVALLVPGFTSMRATFYPLMQPLADAGFRVVSFSQRGQTGSDGGDTPDEYALNRLGADVHAVADALGLGEGIHLLGHSFGGVVGIEAVLQRPERFASYTMWNSGPASLGEGVLKGREALRTYGHRGLWLADATEAGMDPDMDLRGELEGYTRVRYVRMVTTKTAQLDAGLTHLYEHRDRVDELAAALSAAGARALVSHGANDDAWPIDSQRAMAERLGADYFVVAGAGHSAHVDRPLTCAGLLATFWGAGD